MTTQTTTEQEVFKYLNFIHKFIDVLNLNEIEKPILHKKVYEIEDKLKEVLK